MSTGTYKVVENNNDKFFSFIRSTDTETVLVVVSLSHLPEGVFVKLGRGKKYTSGTSLLNGEVKQFKYDNAFYLELPPYWMQIYRLNE